MLLERRAARARGRALPTRRRDRGWRSPTLQALIAARLDALAGRGRTLVQDASVLGLTFPAPALAAVARSGRTRCAELRLPRPAGDLHARRRPTLAGARPASVRPGPPPRGRLRDAFEPDRRARISPRPGISRRSATRGRRGTGQHYVERTGRPRGQARPSPPRPDRAARRAERAADLGSFRLARSYLESALSVVTEPSQARSSSCGCWRLGAVSNAGQIDLAIAHGERSIELADVARDGPRAPPGDRPAR